ncbi:hypothetical protein F5887DRAFT_1082943 [Amanita rubescens]|nr:hypothetical protein F5887DRAFT_1082943 [Amanita rubescens]
MPLPFIPLPSDRVTRASNKDKHPGDIDKPQPRRTHAEVEESRRQEEEKARKEEEERTKHMEMVAAIEDAQRREDERRESERRREADARKKAKAAASKNSSRDDADEAATSTARAYKDRNTSNHDSDAENIDHDECMTSKRQLQKRNRQYRVNELSKDSFDDSGDSGDKYVASEEDEAAKRKKKKTAAREEINKLRKTQPGLGTPELRTTEPKTTHVTKEGNAKSKSKKQVSPAPSGLIPGWDKKKPLKKRPCARPTDDDENAEDNNDVVKFGGYVDDDESDEVEIKAAKVERTKRSKDENMTKIEANPAAPKPMADGLPAGVKNWSLKYLPDDIRRDFEEVVAPRMRKKIGSLPPWESLEITDIQAIVDDVYGKGTHVVTKNSFWVRLANARVNTWRRGFVEAAKSSIEILFADYPDHFSSTETKGTTVQFWLTKTHDEETFVYQWREYDSENRKRKGFLAAPCIADTLGAGHFAKLPETLIDFSEEKPVGALVLAAQAVEHVLQQYTTGKFVKSAKEFSAENYANKEHHVVEPGQHRRLYKKVVTHVTTTMTDSIEEFSETHWKVILDDAYKHYKKLEKKNGGKKKEKMLKRTILLRTR